MTAVLFSVDHHIVAPMWRASSEYLDYLDYFYYPDYFDYPYYFDYPDYFMIFLNIVAPIVILFCLFQCNLKRQFSCQIIT